ncbi:MAG: GNAT family N-acetyltransferase, partial [Chloroflexi bacterium]
MQPPTRGAVRRATAAGALGLRPREPAPLEGPPPRRGDDPLSRRLPVAGLRNGRRRRPRPARRSLARSRGPGLAGGASSARTGRDVSLRRWRSHLRSGPLATSGVVELRPARTADRERVVEICAAIWEGHDYIPEVFDTWVQDPSGTFQVGEVDGEVVALQRIRPLSREACWYEGLRVAETHRRLGIARQMLAAAVDQASSIGFQEMRLATADPAPRALFESAGFRILLQPDLMRARRLEGLEAARMPDPDQADRLFPRVQADPAFELYSHLHVEWDGVYDLTAEELARRAEQGQVRITAGGRALAVVDSNPGWGFLSVRFL